jgi:hypothetical protein
MIADGTSVAMALSFAAGLMIGGLWGGYVVSTQYKEDAIKFNVGYYDPKTSNFKFKDYNEQR